MPQQASTAVLGGHYPQKIYPQKIAKSGFLFFAIAINLNLPAGKFFFSPPTQSCVP